MLKQINEVDTIDLKTGVIIEKKTHLFSQLGSCNFEGIDHADYPDYSDAYISKAEWKDGKELTDEELDELNDEADIVHDKLQDYLH